MDSHTMRIVVFVVAALSGLCWGTETPSRETPEECEFENNVYKNGASFEWRGCGTCNCKDGRVFCSVTPCNKNTKRQGTAGTECELEDGRAFRVGARYNIQCNLCSCLGGGDTICLMKPCPKKSERWKRDTEMCQYNGETYTENERFKTGCHYCVCKKGQVQCQMNACVNYLALKRQAGCEYEYSFYKEDEQFRYDCNYCRCSKGVVHCTMNACLKAAWITDGKCISPREEVYLEGEMFTIKCSVCICIDGKIMCSKAECDEDGRVLDTYPKGEDCFYKGVSYENHQGLNDKCNACRCEYGRVFCTRRVCLWNSR